MRRDAEGEPLAAARDDTNRVATEASLRFGVSTDGLRPLGAFESEVFAFEGPEGACILKVIDPGHRSAEQIRAEVDWLRALLAAGIPVAEPVPSLRGAWVETVDEPERHLVAFRRAPGRASGPAEWSDARLESWGRLLGRLQAHSRAWTPPGPRRHALARQTYLSRLGEYAGRDPEFARAAAAVARRGAPLLGSDAGTGRGVGLIHADLHHGNLLLHEEGWTAIDFDDAAYGAYAFDLAMPLYYAVRAQRERDPEAAAAEFLPPFLRGFRRHAPDPEGGAEAVSVSLEVRTAELVLALWAKLPSERWSDSIRELVRDLRDRTVARRPLLPLALLRRHLGG